MTHPSRKQQRWQTGACAALITALATVAGALAATTAPAMADSGNAGTTTTTVAPAATTTTAPATTTVPAGPNSTPGDPSRLAWIQASSAHLIANRVAALDAAIAVVQKLSFLGTDGTTLVANMQADISGLQALGTTIAGDTSVEQAAQDRGLIFSEFRVYLLVLPVVRDVVVVDEVTNVELPAVQDAITKLQGLETSSNQSFLGPLVTGMQTQVQIATSATAGLNTQLLAFTPSQWDANHRLLANVNSDLRAADGALRLAARDLEQAERFLDNGGRGRRHHHGHGHGHGGGNGGGYGDGTTTTTSTTTTTDPTTTDPTTSTTTTSTTSTSTTTTTALPLAG